MRAIVYEKYGSPDVLELREIDSPVVTDDGVLVRVRASSVNPVDWHTMTGTPYLVRMMAGLLKPKSKFLGVDFAGTVEAVGRDVKQFSTQLGGGGATIRATTTNGGVTIRRR